MYPERRITIESLAKKMSISETLLKKSFSIVYGVPIQSFMREQKMKAAAVMLKQTDMKVADIAMQFGYSNPSKFSAAFRKVIGKTPNDYRSDAANAVVEELPTHEN